MKGIKTTIAVWLCLLCLALLGNTSVRAYSVGVYAGYLKYKANISASDTTQLYEGAWQVYVNITSVTDTMIEGTIEVTNITGDLPADLTPVSPQKQPFSLDTTSWTPNSYSTNINTIIVPAGLRVGDSIPGQMATVQSLTTWNGRQAGVVNTGTRSSGAMLEIDNQTGVLLEANISQVIEEYNTTESVKLTDTNLFSITPAASGVPWWIWAIAIIVIVGTIVGAAVLVRRRKPSVQPTTTPISPPPPPA